MTKLQRRFTLAQFKLEWPQMKGTKISLILRDRQVYMLKVVDMENEIFVGTDGLHRKHSFPFTQIEEVIVEKPA